MTIEEFVRREAAMPFCYGTHDCCTTADKWVRERLGFSPLQRYGRPYTSPAEAQTWLSEFGGIAVAVNRVMRASGLKKTAQPEPGDVGLVIWRETIFMAVLTKHGWFSRSPEGLIMAPPNAAWKAWSIA